MIATDDKCSFCGKPKVPICPEERTGRFVMGLFLGTLLGMLLVMVAVIGIR